MCINHRGPPGHIQVPLKTLNMAYILNFATAKRKYKGIGTHMMQYLEKRVSFY